MGCRDLYSELCSFRNMELAYRKARKNKRYKKASQDFEFNLESNLLRLKHELETFDYKPKPLKTFVIRDPKTRHISASHFRDRVVHHALCNIIQPIFERTFIHDSYANRIGKGTIKAIERFDLFKRKVSQNGRLVNKPNDSNMIVGYVLKADIKHYFDTVDHEILTGLIRHKINDGNVMGLIQKIIDNHAAKCPKKGMPIGNLTSQFFANLCLNELDYFIKHELKARFYIRYVDDFVILHESKVVLELWKRKIEGFLKTLRLDLHPEKSKIFPFHKGTKLLGYKAFYHYKLLKRSNIRTINKRLAKFKELYEKGEMTRGAITKSMESWMAYARHADTYNLRKKLLVGNAVS